jgi:hypothetical protein
VEIKGDDDSVKRCTRLEVDGKRPRDRPRKTWMTTLKDYMRRGALSPKDAWGQRFMEEDPWCKTADLG